MSVHAADRGDEVMTDALDRYPKLRTALAPALQAGEAVKVVVEGAYSQFVVGTDRRVIVYKRGFMAGATFGNKLTSWEYRNITGIQLDSHMASGVLIVRAAGEEKIQASYWASGKGSAKQAPNAITFARKPNAEIQAAVAALRQLIAEAQSGAAPAAGPAASDGIEQLKQLAQLRDSGILSADEFEAKKREILARM